MRRQDAPLTRTQRIILIALGILDILVIGGLAFVWYKTQTSTSIPHAQDLAQGSTSSPIITPMPWPQDPAVSIHTFLQNPDVPLTPGDIRTIAFGQPIRIYWAILDDGTRARFEVSQETGEVIGFLRLGPAPRRVVIDMETAQATASAFAEQHYQGFTGASPNTADTAMPLIQATSPDNDKEHPKFYSFHWAKIASDSGALLPSEVRIWVNAETGQVASYDSLRVAVTVPTQPQVDEATAHKIAREALDVPASHGTAHIVETTLAVSTVPVYEPDGAQALLWRVVVEEKENARGYTARGVVFIDAHTGEVVYIEALM